MINENIYRKKTGECRVRNVAIITKKKRSETIIMKVTTKVMPFFFRAGINPP